MNKEKGKIIDIHVRIDNKFTIDCEMNYYYDDEVMVKSSLYMDKFRGSFIEVNETYRDIFDYYSSLYYNMGRNLSFDEISYVVGISVKDIRTIVKKNDL